MAEVTAPRPLAESDDRDGFDCGRESMNQWFRRHAWANHAAGLSRANVICDGTGRIVGYVTLSAGQIQRAVLPKAQQRNKPDPLPATLLGQLAVHKDHQGKGYALEACLRCIEFARQTLAAGSLVSYIDPRNEPSIRLAKRLGAVYEETIELVSYGPHCVYRHY